MEVAQSYSSLPHQRITCPATVDTSFSSTRSLLFPTMHSSTWLSVYLRTSCSHSSTFLKESSHSMRLTPPTLSVTSYTMNTASAP